MASHSDDESLADDRHLFDAIISNLENLILPNNNIARTSPSQSTTSSAVRPYITIPPALELRQNNPQDCQNLINASIDRATVEISRTIIALNATFSQQLQQASISASNGIKSAQGSASSTIAVVVQSASIATSAASFSITVANNAVASANFALTSVSSASSSGVSTLSSSLLLLQASIASIQVRLSDRQTEWGCTAHRNITGLGVLCHIRGSIRPHHSKRNSSRSSCLSYPSIRNRSTYYPC